MKVLTGMLILANLRVKKGSRHSICYCLNPYIIKGATTCKLVSQNWLHHYLCKFLDLFILENMEVNRELLKGILSSTKLKRNMGFFRSNSYCWNSCIVKLAIACTLVNPKWVHLYLCKFLDRIHSTRYIQTQHHFTKTYI